MNLDLTFLRGQTVTCAVSGGADSVALLHLLHCARKELELTLYAAHYHHGLRQSADGDEEFVAKLCRQWHIPLTVGRGDVAAYAEETGMSMEEAARQLRYEFLHAQPGLIATAHNADDQVETVLLNLLRGTGLKGLCAMERQSGRIVRPMLELTRQQIEDYLAQNGLPHREDETNAQDDALRNRLRHHVIPLLRQENPSLSRTVGRMTRLLQEDEEYLHAQTETLLQMAAKEGGYDCRVLRQSPLGKRAVRSLLQIAKPAACHVDAVWELMQDLRGTKTVQLPTMCVERQYEIVYFGKEPPTAPVPMTVSCDRAGSVIWGAWRIAWQAGPYTLHIRGRQTGDTIRLAGGSKTVKKLLIDKKVPASKRDGIPVVVCREQIVAVGDLVCQMQEIHIEERTQYDQ